MYNTTKALRESATKFFNLKDKILVQYFLNSKFNVITAGVAAATTGIVIRYSLDDILNLPVLVEFADATHYCLDEGRLMLWPEKSEPYDVGENLKLLTRVTKQVNAIDFQLIDFYDGKKVLAETNITNIIKCYIPPQDMGLIPETKSQLLEIKAIAYDSKKDIIHVTADFIKIKNKSS